MRRYELYQRPPIPNGYQINSWNRPPISQKSNTEYEHWCETCDRGFRTLLLLENHKREHQKCNIDGCQFIAHPKVITKHIQMQHSTGLYKKIAKLDNPDEIKKWIEERRKRYPTQQNIEKKAAEMKEKIERGEKLGLYKSHHMRNNNKNFKGNYRSRIDNNKKSKFHHNNQLTKALKPKPNISVSKGNLEEQKLLNKTIEDGRKLKPFLGIHDLVIDNDEDDGNSENEHNFIIEDEEDFDNINDNLSMTQTNEPSVCGALTSLICNYGSSDDESNVEISNVNEKHLNILHKSENFENKSSQNNNSLNVNQIKEDAHNSDDESGPDEEKVVKNNEIADMKNEYTKENKNMKPFEKKRKDRNKNIQQTYKPKFKPKVPSTLLQKLLKKEIQQERNMVLQCIRYIIKNNYFNNKKC